MTVDKERFRIQAEFCKALAHPVRLEVIDRLKHRDWAVKELAAAMGLGQPNLSQHLAALRSRGVVRAVRRGNGVVYSLENRKIVNACALVGEILAEQANRQKSVLGA